MRGLSGIKNLSIAFGAAALSFAQISGTVSEKLVQPMNLTTDVGVAPTAAQKYISEPNEPIVS